MNYHINEKVIIRTNRAGVFYGTMSEYDPTNRTAEITDCRRLWYWDGAASLSQLATEGVTKPEKCKFTVVVPSLIVNEVIEIIPCSDKAINIIENVPVWRA